MSKTGSTALQHGLVELRDTLIRHGALYPTGHITEHNHSFLLATARPVTRLPRHYRPRMKGDRDKDKRLDGWLQDIQRQVAKRRPDVLLLSGEALFTLRTPEEVGPLFEAVRRFGGPVEVVAYLRRPSDWYLSSTQQKLKASHKLKTLQPVSYRPALEAFGAEADRLHVFPYDRESFPGGNILAHFLHLFGPEGVGGGTLPSPTSNTSVSSEGMAVMAAYRRIHHEAAPDTFTRDSRDVLQALMAAEQAVGAARKSRLKPAIASAIDESSVDLLWVRDRYGIEFRGVDYDRVGGEHSEILGRTPRRVAKICEIDRERQERLMHHALRILAERQIAPAEDPVPVGG